MRSSRQSSSANHSAAELDHATDEQLERLGRFEASSLWQELKTLPGVPEVAQALSILTTTIDPVPTAELAYALDPTPRTLPGRHEEIGPSSYLGGREDSEETYRPPSYEAPPILGEAHRNALNDLERRGIIVHEKAQGTRPRHPTYAAALAQVHENVGSFGVESLLATAKRALFSASPRSAVRAAKNLLSIVEGSEPAVRVDLIALLCDALETSVYPGVRDALLVGLFLLAGDLSKEQQELLFRQLESSWELNEHVVWHDDEPYYDTRMSVPMHELLAQRYGWDKKPSSARPGSRRWFWDSIRRETNEPTGDNPLLRSALDSDHALIRGAAAFAIFGAIRCYNRDLVSTVLRDPHPHVLAKAAEGLLRNWSEQDADARWSVLEALADVIRRPEQSPLILHLVLQFEDTCGIYGHDEDIPWNALLGLLAPALLHLEPGTRFNEPHLYNLAERAIEGRADSSLLSAMLSAWSSLLIRRAAVRQVSDYGLSVFSLAIKGLEKDDRARLEILEAILSTPQSGARMMTLHDSVEQWDSLSPQERAKIARALDEHRIDRRWAHVVAISARRVPDEILGMVLGDAGLFRRSASDILSQWPSLLLDDCITFHLRRQGYLASFGIAHWTKPPWKEIIFEVARRPTHPRFIEVIRHLLGEVPDDPEFLKAWESACSSPELIDRLFEQALAETCTYRGWHGQEVWRVLLAHAGEREERWVTSIAENIEAIESHNDLDLFPRHTLGRVFESLRTDSVTLGLLELAGRSNRAELHRRVREMLTQVYNGAAPRMRWVHEAVRAFVERLDSDDEFLEVIKAARHDTIERGHGQWEKWCIRYIDDGWIGADQHGEST